MDSSFVAPPKTKKISSVSEDFDQAAAAIAVAVRSCYIARCPDFQSEAEKRMRYDSKDVFLSKSEAVGELQELQLTNCKQ